MFIILAGTSTYKEALQNFLDDWKISGYTLLEGKGKWNHAPLESQFIMFYEYKDAVMVQDFLKVDCKQKEVDIFEVDFKKVS